MARSPRDIAVADHLWEAFGRMAEEMGSDRESLVNEAMHVFARLNGYVLPGPLGFEQGAPTPSGSPAPRRTAAERVIETAERLERDIARPPPVPEPAAPAVGATLRLRREDGSLVEVEQDRFVIGRGGHCDLVMESGKVSREHAAIVREEDGWYIEDLGSSNGTWHRRERIVRRRIGDGDEYFLCSERFTCVLR